MLFFQVFANAGFWVFEALGGPLGLILAPSWADLVPKWSPKWLPKRSTKSGPKNDPKNDPKKSDFQANFGPQNGPKMGHFGGAAARAEPAGALLKALVFKMAPRWLKMASSSPR